MILLSHEVKLKLQELLKAKDEFDQLSKQEWPDQAEVLNLVDDLCKLLPPEITDGVTTNVIPET